MKKIFRATKDRFELSAFISIIIAMPVAIAVNDFNPGFFMFFVFPCSFIFLRYDDYSHWSPVNKIDNLNRDFFVLCHD